MKNFRHARVWWLGFFVSVVAQPAAAITLQIDYTYDTSNFFGAGNPQGAAAGAQAKAALEAAASYYSAILTDSFTAIQTPAPIRSSVSNGVYTWEWHELFLNPTTGAQVSVSNPTIAANKYVIYAGATDLTGAIIGDGEVGGYGWSPTRTGSSTFSSAEVAQINATNVSFPASIKTRGQTSGFAAWGGEVSFDNTARTWHFDHTTQPTSGQTDFYSTALHEIGHAVGFGQYDGITDISPFQSLVTATNQFIGTSAEAAHSFQPVPLATDLAHWAQGTTSVVYGTSIGQEVEMTPSILDGTRKLVTALDVAALTDIGWTVATPPGVNGDYNGNGVVDAADYVMWRDHLNQTYTLPNDTTPGTVTQADYNVWRSNFRASRSGSGASLYGGEVPEPSGFVLFLACMAALPIRRRLGRGI